RPVLGPRRARAASRPALARVAAAGPAARAPACGGRAGEAGRDDRLLRLHDQRRRERGDRRRERTRRPAARRRVAAVRAPSPAGLPAHAAPRARDERLLHQPSADVESARRVAWREWIRTVEVEPSLYAADFTRLGEQ